MDSTTEQWHCGLLVSVLLITMCSLFKTVCLPGHVPSCIYNDLFLNPAYTTYNFLLLFYTMHSSYTVMREKAVHFDQLSAAQLVS